MNLMSDAYNQLRLLKVQCDSEQYTKCRDQFKAACDKALALRPYDEKLKTYKLNVNKQAKDDKMGSQAKGFEAKQGNHATRQRQQRR